MGLFDLFGKRSIKGSVLANRLHIAVTRESLKLYNSHPNNPEGVTESGHKRTADSVYFLMLQFGLDTLWRTLYETHGPGKYDEFARSVIASLTAEYFEIPVHNPDFDQHLRAFIQKIDSISGEYSDCPMSISMTQGGSPRMNSVLGKSAYLVSEVLGLDPWMPGLFDEKYPEDAITTQNPVEMFLLVNSYMTILGSLQLNELKDASLA